MSEDITAAGSAGNPGPIAGPTAEPTAGKPTDRPVSLLRKRLRKFKSLKRGYYSFLLLLALYIISFAFPILINNKPMVVRYNGEFYFPVLAFHNGETFGQKGEQAEADYTKLRKEFDKPGNPNWMIMPLYPWDPYHVDYEDGGSFPLEPSSRHIMGTDDTGRDIFSRMAYGFNVSVSFAILLTVLEYILGTIIGGVMAFFGGKLDLIGQRIVEVWSTIPFLYTVIIVSSILVPNFMVLIFVITLFNWVGTSYYMRGEFYREKGKDYVAAAIALGASNRQIMFKHILPNSLTPLIAFLPFTIVGNIQSLVALDFLGFGLPAPTPSWGQMLEVGLKNIDKTWLIATPLGAMFVTLLLITFIGEAVREAFDPRVFSRLR
ncbi:MAG TPA: ABC transporter permease subunit [Candidatus Kapabacteria bacterium]|nr:ABC transporter permease subunit [Candidatus Kapabacteria bacterium]